MTSDLMLGWSKFKVSKYSSLLEKHQSAGQNRQILEMSTKFVQFAAQHVQQKNIKKITYNVFFGRLDK